jgi:hypothetical protein
MGPSRRLHSLPFEPLERFVKLRVRESPDALTSTDYGTLSSARGPSGGVTALLGPLSVSYYRTRPTGAVSPLLADRFATFFGVHPTAIWGSEWYAIDVDEAVEGRGDG